jgi:hypothetical protein
MNSFDHKDLGNDLLQLCPKVVKHPVFVFLTPNRKIQGQCLRRGHSLPVASFMAMP